MKKSYWTLILFIFIVSGCKEYDTTEIKDNGVWVSIYDAPISSKYILHNDSVYGIYFNKIDSINWDGVWSEPKPSPIEDVDIETLYINTFDNECNYAKDANSVFCPVCYICIDSDRYIDYNMFFEGDIRIPGADPKTFRYLGDGYAVDKNGMYSCGEKIEWNDSIVQYYNK